MIFPKVFRKNYRRRGPVESYKVNSFNMSVDNAIKELKQEFEKTLVKVEELDDTINSLNSSGEINSISDISVQLKEVEGKIWRD